MRGLAVLLVTCLASVLAAQGNVSPLDNFNDLSALGIAIIQRGNVSVAGARMDAARPDKHTVSFSGEPNVNGKTISLKFTLRYDPANKGYFLTVQHDSTYPLRDFPLTFSPEVGTFTGKGTPNDQSLTPEVSIKRDEEGAYSWDILFKDASGNNINAYGFHAKKKKKPESTAS
jgi:hypothetical protein